MAVPFLEGALQLLSTLSTGAFVSPRALNLTLRITTHCLDYPYTYPVIKPHVQGLIQHIVFPLMCFNDEDQELWCPKLLNLGYNSLLFFDFFLQVWETEMPVDYPTLARTFSIFPSPPRSFHITLHRVGSSHSLLFYSFLPQPPHHPTPNAPHPQGKRPARLHPQGLRSHGGPLLRAHRRLELHHHAL